MRRSLFIAFFVVCCVVFSYSQESGLRINEFQASNTGTIVDDDGLYSDWIELYNASSNSINLAGWSLTDNIALPKKWIFPSVSLNAGGYLLVFASGNDRRIPGKPLHVGFKIGSSGEFMGLYSPEGQPISVFNPFPLQETDQSYGYLNDAWLAFRSPSPGSANTDTSILRFPAPVISRERGIYTQPFEVTISCALPNAAIYYTTDGRVPSLANGAVFYTKSIPITGTTVLRAMAIGAYPNNLKTGDSPVTTQTYIFPNNVVSQSNTPAGYPVAWGKYAQLTGNAIADYEMDPVLMAEPAYAAKVKTSLSELPIVSLVTDKNNLFNNVNDSVTGGIYMFTGSPVGITTGRGWERPVSFEYFYAPDTVSLQVDCGFEIHGGHSRLPEKCPKHSFTLNFKSEYGPSRLYYPFFGKAEAANLHSFILRAGFGNTWLHQMAAGRTLAVYARDEWSKKTQKRMGHLTTNTQYAHLFINGLYWGLYNPTEKIDEDFCETYLGGDKLEYDVIESSELVSANYGVIATSGTINAWNSLFSLVADTTDSAVFQKIQGNNPDGTPNPAYPLLLDMENFIDYMLLNFYNGNTDWDHHNWVAVRNRMIPDKGFRILCWDSEEVLKSVTENLLAENNQKCPSYLFQQLRKNPQFRRLWGDRVQKHCFNNGSLTPSVAAETFTSLTSQIENSVYAESARWGDYRKDVHQWQSVGELYRKDVHFDAQKKILLETYFPQRTNNFIAQLKTAGLFPSVAAPVIKVNGSVTIKDTLEEVDKLSLTATSGSIYFTKDDTDPVKWAKDGTGTLGTSALLYTANFSLVNSMNIKARALYQSVWSALNEQHFILRAPMVGLTPDAQLIAQISATNVPNPFTDQTTFRYSVPFDALVRLELFDVSGRLVSSIVNKRQDAGSYEVNFDGSALPRGIYLCRFIVKGSIQHQKVFKISKW